MNQSPFPEAAPDFSNPLGLLRACHERILQHCATLERLVGHLRDHGVDADARSAAGKIHHYFSTAGRHHHEDEEQDLFPRLARQSLKLADLVHRLRQDHARMDNLWQQLSPLLATPSRITDIDAFATLVDEFTSLHRTHVARENEDLLELARHILSSDELKKLGKQMAERRGQPAPL
ncbi:MAG: hemerythrin domain-containing protein [Pseudomonadota bacterium]